MALLVTIFLLLHFGAGLALPYKAGFKPYFYRGMFEAGIDLEKRLNRETRPQSVRIVRGAMAGLMLGALGCIAGIAIKFAGHITYGFGLQLLFLACGINFMMPIKLVRQIIKHFGASSNELPQAIAALQPYTQEPLANEDAHTVIRKTVEFIAVSFNQFLLAPVFWLLVAGPVGLSLYVTFSALQEAFGLPDSRRKYFGQFVRTIDTALNVIPAALGAVFLAGSSLLLSHANPWPVVRTIYQQCRECGLFYQGWLLSAMAGGMNITLGGPMRYNTGYVENHPWVGPQGTSARLMPDDLLRAERLQYIFFICAAGMISILMILGK